MKVLVTGVNGQLGYDVQRLFQDYDIECIGTNRGILDFSIEENVRNVLTTIHPNVVIHCGAYTAVDMAEVDRDTAHNINVKGTSYLAKCSQQIGAKFVYISTDYVYDGTKAGSYTENDIVNPLSYYGTTKYEGELAVQAYSLDYLIIRTSWVFGIHGNNFVKTMLNVGKRLDVINVVDDQWGSPTYTRDLAKLIYQLIITDAKGIFHAHNEGYCTWYDFATAIMIEGGLHCQVKRITTDAYNSQLTKVVAPRPMNNRLSTNKLGKFKLPTWQDALQRHIKELRDNNEYNSNNN